MLIPDTKAGKWVGWVIGVAGILSLAKDFIIKDSKTAEFVLAIGIISLLFLLIGYLCWREYNVSRKEKYANINESMHRCVHILRDLTTFSLEKRDTPSDDILRLSLQALTEVLTEFVTCFSMLTGTSCRATIKAIYTQEGQLYVNTIARDNKSRDLCFDSDKKRYNNHEDPIDDNDDFLLIHKKYGPSSKCFFCNDLTIKRNYKNSSFKIYGNPPENILSFRRFLPFLSKEEDWPLPYKSTIVWPIQQRDSSSLRIDGQMCIAFLAIDSESRGVFKKKWDFHIGAEIADALYYPLTLLFNFT